MKNLINAVINFFYPYFRRFMPLQTFKYAACGGGNTILDIVLYAFSYNLIFKDKFIHVPVIGIPMSPYIAAFLTSFTITFPLGFYMSRTIVFPGSTLRGRIQLFRYSLLVISCIALNYIFIKLFVEQCHLYPTVSKILTTLIVVAFSFITQKNFTFKAEAATPEVLRPENGLETVEEEEEIKM
ncbi:GtrA family protein [Niastella sp. OAS944]|uniref:GtrA family protein n=1 Tax=Niastella sp. OAS944 TaxID=2664089 RepID=UPI0034730FA3|nr:putative flippase GtrA [Chitinophagaceae bacterium OAS944]